MHHTASIVVAAGKGTRMGSEKRKQYQELKGKPVLLYPLQVLEESKSISRIVLVVPPGEVEFCSELLEKYNIKKIHNIVEGGETRGESVYNGLSALPEDVELVAVHDGARPFLKFELLEQLIKEAYFYRAAVTAVRVKDTIKMSDDDEFVEITLPREKLWAIQTPQVFDQKLLRECYEGALQVNLIGTDDSYLVECFGHKVKIVEGDYDNIKITTVEDLSAAEAILNKKDGYYADRNRF